ncbi:hypothetical protein CBP51_15055 [Cellvibrio mixtus]|uniref:Type I restriction modification DNA specificity domain-containing protein n=2 Tax=Cellvibrio mixtus TaxID=39650 RepID=A0A266Q5Q1_9GAMM|nr:hypothetical protein CBP51_15055 [Cellvibrio mixtus]
MSAQSYRPEITQAIRKIKSFPWAPLQSLVKNVISPGPHPAYGGAYPCLKTKNVNELLADLEPADFADVKGINNLEKVQVERGDLLINLTGAGSIGRVSIYYGDDLPITNQHIARMGIKDAYDEGYVAAFLRTWWGERALEQGVAGSTGQINMVNDHVRSIPVIIFNAAVQKYIGDKVRHAERLRAWAKELRSSVDKVLNQLSLPTADEPEMINRVSTERLEARLDPRPYRTHYINLVDRIKAIKHSCVSDVAELASGCPISSNDFIEGGAVPLVRIRNIGFDEFIDLDTGVTKELHKDEAKYQAKENMIVLGMDGIFRAQFFLSDELPILVNQRVGMISANDIRAELLTHWLNRPEGQMQLNQWAVKTTVEHTSLVDIGRVRIPRLDTDVEEDLADKLLNARRAYRHSRFLTTSAKLLVEALIEGLLTEAELIAAEQAQQAGNDQLDRRILNRLKTGGVDGQGPALFGDLDELYQLLTQAEGD